MLVVGVRMPMVRVHPASADDARTVNATAHGTGDAAAAPDDAAVEGVRISAAALQTRGRRRRRQASVAADAASADIYVARCGVQEIQAREMMRASAHRGHGGVGMVMRVAHGGGGHAHVEHGGVCSGAEVLVHGGVVHVVGVGGIGGHDGVATDGGRAAEVRALLVVLRRRVQFRHEPPVGARRQHRRLALVVRLLVHRHERPEDHRPPRPRRPLSAAAAVGITATAASVVSRAAGIARLVGRRPDLLVHGDLGQQVDQRLLLASVGPRGLLLLLLLLLRRGGGGRSRLVFVLLLLLAPGPRAALALVLARPLTLARLLLTIGAHVRREHDEGVGPAGGGEADADGVAAAAGGAVAGEVPGGTAGGTTCSSSSSSSSSPPFRRSSPTPTEARYSALP